MGFLTLGFLISILCCLHIQAVPVTQKSCLNDFSYILEDKCYSLHTELDFHYKDAIDYCQEHGGTLWSKENDEEVEFLRKIKAKESFHYWVGAHEVPTSLIKLNNNKSNRCLAVGLARDKLIPFSCHHKLYTICEYTGEMCENIKDEAEERYKIITKEENFKIANQTCQSAGGRIAEIKNEDQLSKLMELIRKDKSFEEITKDKLKKLDGSRFPILWHLNDKLEDGNLCAIFQDWTVKTTNCTEIYNFACKFDAINSPTSTVPVDKPKPSRHTTPKFDEQEVSEKPQSAKDIDNSKVSSSTVTLTVVTVILVIALVAAIAYIIQLRRRNDETNPGGEHERLQPQAHH